MLTKGKRERLSFGSWIGELEQRMHRNVAVVAVANKLARIVWAVLAIGATYQWPAERSAEKSGHPEPPELLQNMLKAHQRELCSRIAAV